MDESDLIPVISPYLDRHFLFPLLEFLDTCIDKGIYSYNKQDVAAARLELLRPTHMVDYANEIYKASHDGKDSPEEEEKKMKVFKQLEELKTGAKALEDLCNNEEERVSHVFILLCCVGMAVSLCL